jgi:hypothetical protein
VEEPGLSAKDVLRFSDTRVSRFGLWPYRRFSVSPFRSLLKLTLEVRNGLGSDLGNRFGAG